MPAKSAKQYRMMQAVAHGKSKCSVGPTEAVAKEFIKKTPKKKRSMFMREK